MIWYRFLRINPNFGRYSGRFLVCFGLVLCLFNLLGCSGSKLVWSKGNGILTYNRHTGQLEVMWEHDRKELLIIHDTIYVCPDTVKTAVKQQ